MFFSQGQGGGGGSGGLSLSTGTLHAAWHAGVMIMMGIGNADLKSEVECVMSSWILVDGGRLEPSHSGRNKYIK